MLFFKINNYNYTLTLVLYLFAMILHALIFYNTINIANKLLLSILVNHIFATFW